MPPILAIARSGLPQPAHKNILQVSLSCIRCGTASICSLRSLDTTYLPPFNQKGKIVCPRSLNPLVGEMGVCPERFSPESGTLGALVLDNKDTPLLLSNYHVLCVNEDWSKEGFGKGVR